MKKLIAASFIALSFVTLKAQTINDARKLTDNEQFEAATSIYKVLIATNPSDVVAYYFYGDNLLLSENADSARIIFEKGIAIDPNNALLKIGRAKLLLDAFSIKETKAASEKDGVNPELRHRYEEAVSNNKEANSLIDAAVLNTKDINVLIEASEALIHYKTKDLEKAKTFLDKALAMDAKNVEALLLYGDVYAELNNGTLSADYYNKALDLNKASPRAVVSKGILYFRATNYEGAAEEFKNAIKIDSLYAPAHRWLGETYYKLGKITPAKEEFKKYLEISKNNCAARIFYAWVLYRSKNYAEAITELDQAKLRCDSNSTRILRISSYSYYENKEYQNGLNAIERLFLIVAPDQRIPTDYEFYGKLLIKNATDSSGIYKGIEQLQKALALDPNRPDLLSELADAWIKVKQYPNAITLLRQKVAMGKDVKVTDHYSLAQSFYYNEQFKEADSAATKVNELSPAYSPGWMWRARINTHIDTTSELGLAKPFYEKYIELAINDAANATKYNAGLSEAYGYMASYCFLILKDKKCAVEYLNKKLELPLEPEEKKKIKDQIDQIEGRTPKGTTPPKK